MPKNYAIIMLWTKTGVQIEKDIIQRFYNQKTGIDYLKLKKKKRILPPFPSTYYYIDKKGNRYVLLNTLDNIYFIPAELKEEEINRVFSENLDTTRPKLFLQEFKDRYEKKVKFAKIPIFGKIFKLKIFNAIVIDGDKKTIDFVKLYYYPDRNYLINLDLMISIPYNSEYAINEKGKRVFLLLKRANDARLIKPIPSSYEYFADKEEIEKQKDNTLVENAASFYQNIKDNLVIGNATIQQIEEALAGEKGFFEKYGNILILVVLGMILIMGLVVGLGKLNELMTTAKDLADTTKNLAETLAMIKGNYTMPLTIK
jgi:hypothetical protein